MHTVVARFLKLSEALTMTITCTRLRASQGWCAGEDLHLYWYANLPEETLYRLLRRFHCVRKFSVGSSKLARYLVQATQEGLKKLRELYIKLLDSEDKLPAFGFFQAMSIEIERGAMPLLEKLDFEGPCEDDGLVALLCGWWKGGCPNLHTLSIPLYDCGPLQAEFNVNAFALMLDYRKGLGYCAGLKQLPPLRHASFDEIWKILSASLGTLERLSFEEGVLTDQKCVWLAGLIERGHVLGPQLVRLDFPTAF